MQTIAIMAMQGMQACLASAPQGLLSHQQKFGQARSSTRRRQVMLHDHRLYALGAGKPVHRALCQKSVQ